MLLCNSLSDSCRPHRVGGPCRLAVGWKAGVVGVLHNCKVLVAVRTSPWPFNSFKHLCLPSGRCFMRKSWTSQYLTSKLCLQRDGHPFECCTASWHCFVRVHGTEALHKHCSTHSDHLHTLTHQDIIVRHSCTHWAQNIHTYTQLVPRTVITAAHHC